MPEPLKLSREIAREIFDDPCSLSPDGLAMIIDARIRPLVDALSRIELIARQYVQTGSDRQRPLFWEIHDIAKSAIAISDPPEGDE